MTADSAIVTLALPDIVRELSVPVSEVSWVLIAYNLVLALLAVPAALLTARRVGGRWLAPAGLVLFAAASAACALAPSLEVLIGARVAQAVGGALVITASLELLVAATGSVRAGTLRWAAAGAVGTAIGPVAGGLLTELISWQSIFAVQVPLVLAALPAVLRLHAAAPAPERPAPPGPAGQPQADIPHPQRPRVVANLALALVSAALTAALFLLVLMLIEGWRRSPITAALTVTVIPVAAVLVRGLARRADLGIRGEAVTGAILTGGGLLALAVLPGAELAWTVVPQLLIGAGLGLTVEPLTAFALRDRDALAVHGGWNIASRHLGIVAGLAILTPIFVADLDDATPPARDAVVALVVEAPLPVGAKLSLAGTLTDALDAADSRLPDLAPAFAAADIDAAARPAADRLLVALDDQLDRAATHAFQRAFLVAGLLGLLAILPVLLLPGGDARRLVDDFDRDPA